MSVKRWLASLRIVPLELRDDALDVAIADGSSAVVHDALSRLKVEHVNIYLAPPDDVLTCLNTYYRVLSDTDDNVKQFWDSAAAKREIEATTQRDRRGADHPTGQQDRHPGVARPRVRHPHRADRGRIRIRYRIDGALREVLSLPAATGPELVSRIKIMADMDIVERRRPQDGQFEMTIDGPASTCASPPARRSGARRPCCGCSTRAGR